MIKEFAENNIRFWNASKKYNFIDYPFAYKERQLGSVLLPALYKLTDGCVIQELPATRKIYGEKASAGWIDFWCIYKGFSFVIEVKHSYNKSMDNIISEDTRKKWRVMTGYQMKSIKKDIQEYIETTKGVIRLAMHFVITETKGCDSNNNKSILDAYVDELSSIDRRAAFPNFAALWEIPDSYKFDYTTNVLFPNVMIIGRAYETLLHKNHK